MVSLKDQDLDPKSKVQNVVPEEGPKFGPYIEVDILDLHEGTKSGPRIESPHSAGGSTQVHEGPHRDHGHVLHKVKSMDHSS
jgi:hypothetical protein